MSRCCQDAPKKMLKLLDSKDRILDRLQIEKNVKRREKLENKLKWINRSILKYNRRN